MFQQTAFIELQTPYNYQPDIAEPWGSWDTIHLSCNLCTGDNFSFEPQICSKEHKKCLKNLLSRVYFTKFLGGSCIFPSVIFPHIYLDEVVRKLEKYNIEYSKTNFSDRSFGSVFGFDPEFVNDPFSVTLEEFGSTGKEVNGLFTSETLDGPEYDANNLFTPESWGEHVNNFFSFEPLDGPADDVGSFLSSDPWDRPFFL